MQERIFSDFIVKKNIDKNLSDEELEVIQAGEMSGLLRCFYNITAPQKHSLFECAMKAMEKYLKIVSLEDIVKSNHFMTQDFVIHEIGGSVQGMLGFSGNRAAMRLLALDYVERNEAVLLEDWQITATQIVESIESLIDEIFCRFNDTFKKDYGTALNISEPIVASNAVLESEGGFYVLNFKILGREVNMILGIMDKIQIILDGEAGNE